MACVAHSGMAADEIAENIDSAVSTIVTKLRMVSLLPGCLPDLPNQLYSVNTDIYNFIIR